MWAIVAWVRGSPSLRYVLNGVLWVGTVAWVGPLAFRPFGPLEALPSGQRLTPDPFPVVVAPSVIVFVVFAMREAVRAATVLFATVAGISALRAASVVIAGGKDGHVRTILEAERLEKLAYADPVTGLPNRRRLDERIRRQVAEHAFPSGVRITVSFGAAAHRESASVRNLIRRADARLYDAKEAGRERVVGAGEAGAGS